jgi:hypothetical protein
MIDVLDWVKKRAGVANTPKPEPRPADAMLPDLRDSDPVIALNELGGWLEPSRDQAAADPKARGDILSQVQDAGRAHVAALVGQYLEGAAQKQAARESVWKSLVQYQARLTHALGVCAKALLGASYEDATLLADAEVCAARALQSGRALAKICLLHYTGVPGGVWRLAYALYSGAEEIGSATSPVKAEADPKKVTTVEQEFLRLLMLRASEPDMLAPEQIEVADRVLEQLGESFTLRPPGVADNPFCFDPQGDLPPRRANAEPPGASTRYFGPGMGFDALERIQRQLGAARLEDVKVFGADLTPAAQLDAVEHLLAIWRANPDPDHAPPVRNPAQGTLKIHHGYGQVWRQLNDAQHGAGELSLADPDDLGPQPPETWTLREASDAELAATFAQPGAGWARCGAVLAVTPQSGGECWVGVIHRMHCEPNQEAQVDIALLSRKPQALQLREVRAKGEESAVSEAASRQFDSASVRAIVLSDAADGPSGSSLLLPAASWKPGRIYETADDPVRRLRAVQAIRYGDDYVRAKFEWLPGAA